MSRLMPDRLGYTGINGFECSGWSASVYEGMDGEGCGTPQLNRYLNFPRRLQGETAFTQAHPEFHNMQEAIESTYKPAGFDPDPVNGDYLNLYSIVVDPLPGIFTHACFPINTCNPSEYIPGYLDVPIPFISYRPPLPPIPPPPDPGMTGLCALTDVDLYLDETGLVLESTVTCFERASGESVITDDGGTGQLSTADTTEC